MLKVIVLTLCLGLLASACVAEETSVPPETKGLKAVEDADIKAEPLPELPGSGDTGAAPQELLDAITNDLAQHLGVAVTSLQVVSARSVVFNDGSLGCPKPGEQYTQALVDGFQVMVTDGTRKYDYRADNNNRYFRCEKPAAKNSGPDPRE